MTDTPIPEEEDMLAVEYVLGVLEGDALAKASGRLARDRDFAERVADWETRLATLADDLAPVEPRAATKAALMTDLFPSSGKPTLWKRLWIWQAVSALSLAMFVAIITLGPVLPPRNGPPYTAEIASDAGDFRVVAVVDKQRNEVVLTRTVGDAPPGRVLQVWAHGPGEPALSIGLWPAGQTGVSLPLPQTIAEVEGVLTLGISEEPPGGSTTGSPSGRVFGTVDIPGVTGDF
jgi:anti-sigma-K factor RskA